MGQDTRDPISSLGLAVAPLFALPAAALYLALWHWDTGAARAALPAALTLLPLSYSLSWLVGIPYLYALDRLGLLGLPSLALGGTVLGFAVGTMVALALFPTWDWYARLFYIGLGPVCGAAVASGYGLLAMLRGRARPGTG